MKTGTLKVCIMQKFWCVGVLAAILSCLALARGKIAKAVYLQTIFHNYWYTVHLSSLLHELHFSDL